MNPSEIARAITAVLGEENIESATHCMTRLHLRLKDQNDHKREALKKIPGVLGVNMSGEELQRQIARMQAQIDRQLEDYARRPKRLTYGVNATGVNGKTVTVNLPTE